MIDVSKICDIEVDGIQYGDYPDYCNAYVCDAWLEITLNEYERTHLPVARKNGKFFRQLSEFELNNLNENFPEFVYQATLKQIF